MASAKPLKWTPPAQAPVKNAMWPVWRDLLRMQEYGEATEEKGKGLPTLYSARAHKDGTWFRESSYDAEELAQKIQRFFETGEARELNAAERNECRFIVASRGGKNGTA